MYVAMWISLFLCLQFSVANSSNRNRDSRPSGYRHEKEKESEKDISFAKLIPMGAIGVGLALLTGAALLPLFAPMAVSVGPAAAPNMNMMMNGMNMNNLGPQVVANGNGFTAQLVPDGNRFMAQLVPDGNRFMAQLVPGARTIAQYVPRIMRQGV